MPVFSSLLPGVRHVRAPLVAGFLWLLGLWLLIAGRIPAREHATGGLRTLIDLGDRMGRISLGVVAQLCNVTCPGMGSSLLIMPPA